MALWEYKVITSGKGGFASPALLEKFLNDLGRDEWEIIHFQSPPDNFLAFTGLARRSTQRDWTLEDAAAAAAKAEAEKLRAEFEAKFRSASSAVAAGGAEERSPSFLEEKLAPDDGYRKPVDTSHDNDPESEEEEKADEWDKLTEEEELPTFFDAIKPHMRRNQRGPGMSVGVDFLAKKWDQSEDDLKGALLECGFVMPADEDAKPEYLEYDGDLYWLNVNRRGELWINTKEKPRPVFRPVKAQRVEIEPKPPASAEAPAGKPAESAPEPSEGVAEPGEPAVVEAKAANNKPQTREIALPEGATLLDKIRPHMRRNRRGPGGSGSTSFLSRALRTNEGELKSAFAALGLTIPSTPADKAVYTEIGREVWWLNLDSRGGLWINGREKKHGEVIGAAEADAEMPGDAGPATPEGEAAPGAESTVPAVAELAAAPVPAEETPTVAPEAAPSASASEPPAVPASETASAPVPPADLPPTSAAPTNPVLAAIRLMLKEGRGGTSAGKVERLAEEFSKTQDELVGTLVEAGLKVPEKPREKPVRVEQAGELLWLSRTAKGELWLNAKPARHASKEDDEGEEEAAETGESDEEKKAGRRSRGRGKKPESDSVPEAAEGSEPA